MRIVKDKTLAMDIQIGDTHVGHKTGIMYPHKYTGDYQTNPVQQWIWLTYKHHFLIDLKSLITELKPGYIHANLGGDLGDIDQKDRSQQFWSKDPSLIADNAHEVLLPVMELCDDVHSIKGTKSHTGHNSFVDDIISKKFDNVVRRNGDDSTFPRVVYDINGIRVDVQHKGKNKSAGTILNLMNSLRRDIIIDRAANKIPIPDVVVRFHNHWGGISSDMRPIIVQNPSWQLPYDYIHEIDAVGTTPVIGCTVLLYRNGEVDIKKFWYTYRLEKVWKPSR